MNFTPYVASLRVYEPLESFDYESRSRWELIPVGAQTIREESKQVFKNLILWDQLRFFEKGAHSIDFEGNKFVSPWSLKSRAIRAMQEFRESIPSSLFPLFIPSDLENFITSEMETENKVSHILAERWMIPPRWFALFRSHERLLRGEGFDVSCVYRTRLSIAIDRCLETHKIVRKSFGAGSIEMEISDLLNWLELFNPNSLLELDYGGLAQFVEKTIRASGGKGLQDDTSLEDVLSSISSLSAGDGVSAGASYSKLVNRWRQIANFEQAQ